MSIDPRYLVGFIGVLGAVLLLIAWIPQTLRTMRTRRTGMEPKFMFIYFFGSLFLAAYAYFLEDFVFLVLNASATLLDTVNIYYYYTFERGRNKSRLRRKR